jgi:hypothetical protein
VVTGHVERSVGDQSDTCQEETPARTVAVVSTDAAQNALTEEESASGWELLFDGASLAAWRGFRRETMPDGWRAVDGALVRVGRGGDIVTIDTFGDFELRFDWKVEVAGNSGVFFRVTEAGERVWFSGPEFQVLDNAGHADGRNPLTTAGSNYALHAPVRDATRPVGDWNAARLLVRGAHVEHWMNGVGLLGYELGSADWQRRVAASKFASLPRYGREPGGHIAIQDHGDRVAYRNLKIRRLETP